MFFTLNIITIKSNLIMKRKKLERKQEDRKQSGEGNHHAGQSSHMTPPRTRNVSRECTPNNLKRKVDCVIYTSNSKTRLSKSPQTNRYNSDKKKIPSDFEEALDSSSGINFRSGRRIHYTSSSKPLLIQINLKYPKVLLVHQMKSARRQNHIRQKQELQRNKKYCQTASTVPPILSLNQDVKSTIT